MVALTLANEMDHHRVGRLQAFLARSQLEYFLFLFPHACSIILMHLEIRCSPFTQSSLFSGHLPRAVKVIA